MSASLAGRGLFAYNPNGVQPMWNAPGRPLPGLPPVVVTATGLGTGGGVGIGGNSNSVIGHLRVFVGVGAASSGTITLQWPVTPPGNGGGVQASADWASLVVTPGVPLTIAWTATAPLVPSSRPLRLDYQNAPSSGDPYFASTVLLYHCDGTNGATAFVDNSALGINGNASTGATLTTAQFVFGTGSANFPNNGGAVASSAASSNFNFGAGQFTVEAWGRTVGSLSVAAYVLASQLNGGGQFGWRLEMLGPSTLRFLYSLDGSTPLNVPGTYTPTPNVWTHYAADRDASGTIRVYANGAVIASAVMASSIFASLAQGIVGNDGALGSGWVGQIDDIRITKGVGRYGGPFAVPSAPYPNQLPT